MADPSALDSILTLMLGFAFAGLLASGFELMTERRASFHLLQGGDFFALASVPVIVFSAPVIIIRNTVRGRRIEGRPIPFVMMATIIACFWSMLCGTLVLDVTRLISGV
jgi:hypothetical protein